MYGDMSLINKVSTTYNEKGLRYLLHAGTRLLTSKFSVIHKLQYNLYYKFFNESFYFCNNEYHYFIHPYNTTWTNERAVEVPIILEYLKSEMLQSKNVLEIGNVLSHYVVTNHDILDKYEVRSDVINQDIVDFNPKIKYDLILSISTLEHVGFDEMPRDPNKIIYALNKIQNLLSEGGEAIITLPLGYNEKMDKMITENKIQFDEKYILKRIAFLKWIEIEWDEINEIKYDKPFPNANGLIIGIINCRN
jgi:hypothetical protein